MQRSDLHEARVRAPVVVAADGAVNRLHAWGVTADAVVGDMDSIDPGIRASLDDATCLLLDEQETTDFEKCLYATDARLYIGIGFTGARLDHMLAVFHGMLVRPEKTVVLIGEQEVMTLVPTSGLCVRVDPGAVVSIYPLRSVTGRRSEGLKWSIDGLAMEAGTAIGTSNEATSDEIDIAFDRLGALLLLPRRYLDALIDALAA